MKPCIECIYGEYCDGEVCCTLELADKCLSRDWEYFKGNELYLKIIGQRGDKND